ncbi:MAG TPA: paraquat-inducible protein A [Telmatospirillum sp.]|nr:paraquat-inducible protein A [Telmatospirillum sp.]
MASARHHGMGAIAPNRYTTGVLGNLLRACDDCGLLLRLPSLQSGMDYRCPCCGAVLRRHHQSPLSTPLALAATSLILCAVTLTTPFLTVRLLGRTHSSTVESGAWAFLDDGLWVLSLVLLTTVVLAPLLRLSLRLVVLGGLALRRPPPWLFQPLRWHGRLGAWSMLEIFLFGALVSYVRLEGLAEVQLGPAVCGLAAVVLAMVAALADRMAEVLSS